MQLSACTSSGLDSEPESFCRKFPLSPAVRESGDELERHHGRSSDKETNLQDNCDGPEIIELSKLDHFVSVLQEAQRVAVEAQREKDKQRTRPKTYTRKSRTSSWRYKKHQDDLMKQGYLPVFDFISHVKKKNKHKAPPKLLATEATKRGAIVFEEEEEEVPPKLLETEATSRAAIVFEEEEEEEEDGGNGPEGKSTSNPMSVVQVRPNESLFQITMAS